ncbi:hypothetical protein V2J09_022778 [Rumex salicifolius]
MKGAFRLDASWNPPARSGISECITCKFSNLKEFVTEQITESLKRCGISDNTTYILAAQFNASPEQVEAVGKLVKGKEISLDELESRANHAQVQKHYKISVPELGVGSLADAIVCRIAARDAL